MKVDSNGYGHFMYYNGTSLYYMLSNNGFTTIPSPVLVARNAGEWSTMALTSSGTPVIVYYDPSSNSLKYTYPTSLNPSTGSATWSTPKTILSN